VKRLLLLRHAKAISGTTKSGDPGRPLNDRGRKDAPRMGVAMQHRGYFPDRVLCSPAKRTRETWEHVAPELDAAPEAEIVEALYLAPWRTIATAVRGIGTSANTVLVLGHNPGIEECAQALARNSRSEEEHARLQTLRDKFPTGALAVIDFDIATWDSLAAGSGALVDFLRPKDLMDG
jgi:phosphohistidine phosphatase